MYATASKEVREALTSNWAGVQKMYANRQFEDICRNEFNAVQSPALRLSKFVHLGENSKRYECDAVVATVERHKKHLDDLIELFKSSSTMPNERRFALRLEGRMIINHTGGVLENAGLALHPHSGMPFIPGSAIKGVSRHAAWCRWKDAEEGCTVADAENIALKMALIFGFPSGDKKLDKGLDKWCAKQWPDKFGVDGALKTLAGGIAFMPAMPTESIQLVTDIVNCHHQEYYRGKQKHVDNRGEQKPVDNERLNPQFFPAVEKGSGFEFILRPLQHLKNMCTSLKIPFDDIMSFAEKLVREAAEEYGFGSKTSNGYGWFMKDTAFDMAIAERNEKKKLEQEEKKRIANLSPEELYMEEYLKTLGAGDADGMLKGKMREISNLEEAEQKCICLLLQNRFSAVWKADVKVMKKREKVRARVESVRSVAQQLGVDLP